jgi:hypothetical protein
LKPVPSRKSNTRRDKKSETIWLVVSVNKPSRALGISRQTLRLPSVSS